MATIRVTGSYDAPLGTYKRQRGYVQKKDRMRDSPITLRKYANFDDIKADEYRYWQSRPAHERLDTLD